ncbi:MAG: P44/Msp2 family outer membrane protein [Rickettsiales bacterium]|jgi:opacity protein-like surface antigen|nr:P44/Msp2 family outer membrane protein [Rickettsiales bacterium]MDR1261102.1 P44/Msp2 family outer membrane protein [Rickettsiales bacterium]
MSNKKTLAVTAFALLLSQQSFASETEGFYFGGGYYGQFFNSIGSLGVKAAEGSKYVTVDVYVQDKIKGQKPSEYKGDYNPPFAGNIAFGYTGGLGNNSYRAELEGIYSSVKADNVGLEGNQMSVLYLKEISGKKYMYDTKVDNNKIENASVMVNAYYHLKNDSFFFSPYVGAGVGLTRMKMFGEASIRPAYQLKAGLDYSVNENVNMHVGYRHFGAFGTDHKLKANVLGEVAQQQLGNKKISVLNEGEKPADMKLYSEGISIDSGLFTTHGIEAGLTFHFASKS